MSTSNSLIGVISARYIEVLLQKKCWISSAAELTYSQKLKSQNANKAHQFSSPQGNLVHSHHNNDWASSSDEASDKVDIPA